MDLFWRVVLVALDLASASAWAAGHYLESAGWALLLAIAWAVRAYFWPFVACGRCKGTGRRTMGRRFGDCRRCKGSGRRQVLGSKQVHKAVRGIRGKAWERKK